MPFARREQTRSARRRPRSPRRPVAYRIAKARDGKLPRGKLGPARRAAATGAAIVPVGLVGTDQVQLPEERLPHLFRPVSVRFGPPVHLSTSDGKSPASRLRATTDEVMQNIAA